MAYIRKIDPGSLLWAGYCGMFFFVPVATSPTVICGALVLGLWIISGKFLRDSGVWRRSGVVVPILVLIALPWIGLLYTPLPDEGLAIALKTHYWFYAFVLAPLLPLRRNPDLVIKMFLAGLALNSVISVLQFGGIVPLKKGLATGLLGGSSAHIAYSLLLASGILIASFFSFKAKTGGEKAVYVALILLYFLTIGFTGGRSGYLALIILSPLLVRNVVGQRRTVITLMVSVLAVSLLFVSPVVRSRFLKAKEDITLYKQGDLNTSLGQRFHMWEIALSEIKKSPLIGIGTGGFAKSWEINKKDPSLPFHSHPHNTFLYLMVSFGIAGPAAFVWLLSVMLKRGWKGRDSALGFAVFAFTVVFAVGSLTDTQILPFATAVAFPLFVGLSEAVDV